jgi:hypothetical protein
MENRKTMGKINIGQLIKCKLKNCLIKIISGEIILLLLFISCTDNNRNQYKYFESVQSLKAERITIDSIFNPAFIFLKNNRLIFSAYKSPRMLYVYSLPDLDFLYATGEQGHGPEDFELFPMFCKSFSDDIYIWGYTPTRIKQFAVSQSGELHFKRDINLSLYESFNQMHIVQDSLLIYSAIPSDFSINKYNMRSHGIEGKIDIKKEDHAESFFYSNRGMLAANDSLIIYSYIYKNQIDIYHVDDLKLHKRIVGDYSKNSIIIGDFENNVNHYLSVLTGKKYFYALYNGKLASNEKDYAIEVFDYDGTPVKKYLFDIAPILFEIDEENGYIYGYNANYEGYILKYKI